MEGHVDSSLFEPIRKSLKLKVITDPPLSLIREEKEERGKSIFDTWSKTLIKLFKGKKGEEIPREFKTFSVDLITSSPEKIFKFLEKSTEELVRTQEFFDSLLRNGDENAKGLALNAYPEVLSAALFTASHEDSVIRVILDDSRAEDGKDFIPFLTLTQREELVKGFYEVNPFLGETQKKAKEAAREVERRFLEGLKEDIMSQMRNLEKKEPSTMSEEK